MSASKCKRDNDNAEHIFHLERNYIKFVIVLMLYDFTFIMCIYLNVVILKLYRKTNGKQKFDVFKNRLVIYINYSS